MGLETAGYISQLNAANPLPNDPRSEGDDHIRMIKAVLLATFPKLNAAITASVNEMNALAGVSSSLQGQLDALATTRAPIGIGKSILFFEATAPTGWTQVTAHNNKAIRIVSGAGAGSGGSSDFTTVFASQAIAGTVGGTALTKAQIPPHQHGIGNFNSINYQGGGNYQSAAAGNVAVLSTDGSGDGLAGQSHTHSFTGTALNLAVKYVDVIIATRQT